MAEILIGNIKGEKGDTGNGLTIMNYFDTIEELPEHPYSGDAYGIKNGDRYDIYIYSENKGWVNNGALQPDINEQAPNYGEATTLENLTSGEKISIAFGKIKKAITELISHLGNKNNPHGVKATDVGAVSLTGGMLSGDLTVAKDNDPSISCEKINADGSSSETIVRQNGGYASFMSRNNPTRNSTGNYRALRLYDPNKLDDDSTACKLVSLKNGVAINYNVFGEHNKPSSTYVGNGSATSRSITIGGTGKALLVYGSGNSDDSPFIVTRSGAFGKGGTTCVAFSRNNVKFENGVLTIATDSPYFNANTASYVYQVL